MLRKSYHMKMDIKLLELYSDYIISSFGQITATGLSRASSGIISHDKITRFLSEKELDSKQLWKLVKPLVREKEQENGVLIVDDTIENKGSTVIPVVDTRYGGWSGKSKSLITMNVKCESLKKMVYIKNAIATAFENLNSIIKPFDKATG